MVFGSAEQALEQRDQHGADESHSAARHELLDALRLRTGVVVAIAFQQVDDTPHAETGTEGDNEGLENGNCLIEKFHK